MIISSLSEMDEDDAQPRTELDLHANMAVVGKYVFVFESTGKICNVTPFSEELGIAKNVPIVDAAIVFFLPNKLLGNGTYGV